MSNKSYGKKEKGCFGREATMGIPSYDGEPEKAKLVPLRNKFSAQHDNSQEEIMRAVRGHGSSSMISKMNATD